MCLFAVKHVLVFLVVYTDLESCCCQVVEANDSRYLSRSVSCKIWWAESTIFGGASSWSGRCSMTCPAVEDELAVIRPHFLK